MIVVSLKSSLGYKFYEGAHKTFEEAVEAARHALLTQKCWDWEKAVANGVRLIVSVGAPESWKEE